MSSVLQAWWREARDAAESEREAVGVIAARLGESESETRRLLGEVAKVKLKGAPVRRSSPTAKPAARPVVGGSDGSGHRAGGDEAASLDRRAVRDFYRAQRLAGCATERALKMTASRFNERPANVRRVVSSTEFELQHPPDPSH